MTSPHADFLRTIIAMPDDDTPRLVFADWLEENGDAERAEFIRVQCELARIAADDPRRGRLKAREQDLLRQYQVVWWQQLPELEEARWEAFERGFVAAIRVESADAFINQAEHIFESAPIREVRFHRIYQDGARKVARSPFLAQLRILDLEDGNIIGNAGLEALADSPYITGLTALKLRSNGVGPAGVRALARSPQLGPLTDLNLDHNGLYDEGVQAIAESARMQHLTRLSLGWTQCGDSAVAAIAESPYLAGLNWLYLSGNLITDDGLSALANSEHLGELRALYLEANRIGDLGAAALAESSTIGNLVWLYLRNNRIGDVGGQALAHSLNFQNIAELVLIENAIGLETTRLLRERFGRKVWLW